MPKLTPDFIHTNTVPTPLAQNTKVLRKGSCVDAQINRFKSLIAASFYFQGLAGAVAFLLFDYGIRISEALNIHSSNVSESGLIYIKGLKGSQDRYIQALSHLKQWDAFRCGSQSVSFYYSRFYFYNHFKQIGVGAAFGSSKYKSVCHAARHLFALKLQDLAANKEAISNAIGHKSTSSTTTYLKSIATSDLSAPGGSDTPEAKRLNRTSCKFGILDNNISGSLDFITFQKDGHIIESKEKDEKICYDADGNIVPCP